MIIWTLAKTTVGDAMRKKVLQIFVVVAIGMIVMSMSFSQTLSFSTRQDASLDLNLIKSFGLGLMAIAGALISIVMGVQLIPQEIERRTIYTILSKPVKRYEFIIGKILGAVMTLALNILIMGIVFIVAVTLKAKGIQMSGVTVPSGMTGAGIPIPVQWFDINMVYGVWTIFLQFMVLTSVVVLFSVFLTPTVNFFMGTAVYILGMFAPMLQSVSVSKSVDVVTRSIYTVLHTVLPNFDYFNVTNTLLHPEATIVNVGAYTLKVTLYAVIYVLFVMLAALIVFDKKEV